VGTRANTPDKVSVERRDLERGVHCKPPDEESVEKKRPFYIKAFALTYSRLGSPTWV